MCHQDTSEQCHDYGGIGKTIDSVYVYSHKGQIPRQLAAGYLIFWKYP